LSDQPPRDDSADRTNDPFRSPVRPTPPSGQPPAPAPKPIVPPKPDPSAHDPNGALNAIRVKMELISDEFAQGKINSVQFHAMYKRYSEQRTIIEKLIERDPDSDAWQRVMSVKGQTGFLRSQFAAQAQYYAVMRVGSTRSMISGGKIAPDDALLAAMAGKLWTLPNRPNPGLARKSMPGGQWVIVATGTHAATIVVFSLEPANAQARLVRDLHADFERANAFALDRGQVVLERMVFPQRALAEGSL